MAAGWRRRLNNSSDAPNFLLLGDARAATPLHAPSFSHADNPLVCDRHHSQSGPGTNQGAAQLPLVRHSRTARASVPMSKFAIIAALAFAASPAAAQVATPNGLGQLPLQSGATAGATGTTGGASGSAQRPTTGVFCIEEMTANFCNVVSGPNTGGYGATSGSGSSGGATSGLGGGTSSIPPCAAEAPFNELCN